MNKEIPTPLTTNAMQQMACFADHPAVQCLNDLARQLERDRHELLTLARLISNGMVDVEVLRTEARAILERMKP